MAIAKQELKESNSKIAAFSPDWQETKTVLMAAEGMDSESQTRFVEGQLPDDPELRTKVLSLIATIDEVKHALPTEGGDKDFEDLLRVGEQYGSYRVIEKIGRGGMGQVWLAEDVLVGHRVALKTVASQWMDSPAAREQLLREAHAVAKLEHPNIVRFSHLIEESRCFIMVMEFIEGRTAADIIQGGRVPLGYALRLGLQICDAIVYAHDHGVLHCDIKPSNVQVTGDGTAKVLDFGLARARFGKGRSDRVVSANAVLAGTPAYMAPERFPSRGDRDNPDPANSAPVPKESSDIYSLGVTLFELVTGRKPFDESHLGPLIGAILTSPTPKVSSFIPSCPEELDRVIERAMAKDSMQRYQSARELSRDLRKTLRSLDEDHSVVHAHVHHSRWLWPSVILGAIAALLLMGFLTSIFYSSLLRIPMFENESPLVWPVWAIRALVVPLFQMGLAVLAVGLVLQFWKMATAFSQWLRRQVSRVAASSFIRKVTSAKISIIAAALLLVQTVTVELTVWRFSSIFESFSSLLLGTGSLEVLGPGHNDEHHLFRRAFALLVLAFGWGWYRLMKSRLPESESIRIPVAGGAALIAFSIFFMIVPYRLFIHNTAELVFYQSRPCYVIGDNAPEVRLFCPGDNPRSLKINRPELHYTGVTESIFTIHNETDLEKAQKSLAGLQPLKEMKRL